MTNPIEIPDGIYVDMVASSTRFGHIDKAIERALAIAERDGVAWLVFNGTSVRVRAGDAVEDVARRWTAHREHYQAERGAHVR